MTYEFCLNPLSLPADTPDNANNFLKDIFTGIAGLPLANSVISLYSDKELDKTEISPGWTYYNFKYSLIDARELDLANFVFELEDKSPFLEFIRDEEFLKLTEYDMKLFNTIPMDGNEYDIIKFACLHDAILISLPTSMQWEKDTLPVSMTNISTYEFDEVNLLNVFGVPVGHLVPRYDWKKELSEKVVFSLQFDEWYKNLYEKNQFRVANLLKRANAMNFNGTDKQTRAIEGSSKAIREWRGGCPCSGSGRIRVFYKTEGDKTYILYGFIKTSDNYEAEIRAAETAFDELTF
jgi:hypothetical protein